MKEYYIILVIKYYKGNSGEHGNMTQHMRNVQLVLQRKWC